MGISPWVAGQTDPAWEIPCSRDGADFILTGQIASNISILFYNNVQSPPGSGSYTRMSVGGGQIQIMSGDPGIIAYYPLSGDTSLLVPGQYWVRVLVMMNGTNPNYSDYISLVIQA